MQSLTEKYRPKLLSDIVGQEQAVETLRRFISRPCTQAFIFAGLPGSGKTSAALAVANELGCMMEPRYEECGGFHQIPSGEQTAESVRSEAKKLSNVPMWGSGWHCLVINEADKTTDKAQTIWLDVLEKLPSKCVVIFTTNSLSELEPRFQERCMVLNFASGTGCEYTRAANELISRIWRAERLGEAIPTISDLDALPNGSAISYRKVVQSVARRLLDPSPFVPAPAEAPQALFVAPKPSIRPAAKPVAPVKSYKEMTWMERKAADKADFLRLSRMHFEQQAASA